MAKMTEQQKRDLRYAIRAFDESRALTKKTATDRREAEAALVAELSTIQKALEALIVQKEKWRVAALVGSMTLQALEDRRRW